MRGLEEIIIDKIYEVTNYALSKVIKPDITVDTVTDLDEETIKEIKRKYEIEGVILDVDHTLRKDMKKIPNSNKEWINQMKKMLKVIVVSNGLDRNVEKYLKEQGIEYIGFASKPLKFNFIRACQKMRIKPEQVLVIGNSLLHDIYGGKRNNMTSVLVKSVNDDFEKE